MGGSCFNIILWGGLFVVGGMVLMGLVLMEDTDDVRGGASCSLLLVMVPWE